MEHLLQQVAHLEELFSEQDWQQVESLNQELLGYMKDYLDGKQGLTEPERLQLEDILARYKKLIQMGSGHREAARDEISSLNRAEKISDHYTSVRQAV